MRILALISFFNLLFFFTFNSSETFANAQYEDIRPGDFILISLNCYSCPIIEDETNSPYSHSGLIIEEVGKLYVLEALGKVQKTPFERFLKYRRPNTTADIFRPHEFQNEDPTLNAKILKKFNHEFKGKPFDSFYLWDNFDQNGNELLYCSEMITKLINHFLSNDIPTDPMDFTKNWDYWDRFYQGNVPQGQPGNGPEVFSRASHTYFVKSIF